MTPNLDPFAAFTRGAIEAVDYFCHAFDGCSRGKNGAINVADGVRCGLAAINEHLTDTERLGLTELLLALPRGGELRMRVWRRAYG